VTLLLFATHAGSEPILRYSNGEPGKGCSSRWSSKRKGTKPQHQPGREKYKLVGGVDKKSIAPLPNWRRWAARKDIHGGSG